MPTVPKVATQIRLDELIYGKIKFIAAHELRTMNAQMEYFILTNIRLMVTVGILENYRRFILCQGYAL